MRSLGWMSSTLKNLLELVFSIDELMFLLLPLHHHACEKSSQLYQFQSPVCNKNTLVYQKSQQMLALCGFSNSYSKNIKGYVQFLKFLQGFQQLKQKEYIYVCI